MKLPKIVRNISDLVFPNVCVGCEHEIASHNQVLCIRCLSDIPFTDQFDFAENAFTRHFWGRVPVVDGASLLIYTPKEITQKIIHNFKYRNQQQVGIVLGKMIGRRIKNSSRFNALEAIVPVPLTEKRTYERGFNQSLILSEAIREEIDVPVVDNALNRIKDTSSQTKKTRHDRIQNMANAFSISNPDSIIGKHVLLVDDVMTTGATLEACALELAPYAHAISMVTLALGK